MVIGVNGRFLMEEGTGFASFLGNLLPALIRAGSRHRWKIFLPSGALPPVPEGAEAAVLSPAAGNGNRFDRLLCRDPLYRTAPPDLLWIPAPAVPEEFAPAKLVLTVHDLAPAYFLEPASWFRHPGNLRMISSLGFRLRFIEGTRVNRAHLLLPISGHTAADITRFWKTPPEKVRCIYQGINPAFLSPPEDRGTARLAGLFPVDRPYLLNFGGGAARKNLNRQVQSWLQLPAGLRNRCRLLITAEGYWRRRLDTAAHRQAGIHFIGKQPFPLLHALLYNAAGTVYTSLYEGFGLPFIESVAAGIPAVVSDNSSMAELLSGFPFKVDPFSIPRTTAAMQQILEDPHRAARICAPFRTAAAQFTCGRTAAAYLEAFEETAGV